MFVLAVDPGETVGLAWLLWEEATEVTLAYVTQVKPASIRRWSDTLANLLTVPFNDVTDVVLEDYRIYPGMEKLHIGNRLWSAELIGATLATIQQTRPSISSATYPASMKGQWPLARLKSRYPAYFTVPRTQEHARDAVILGLIHLERNGWKHVHTRTVPGGSSTSNGSKHCPV